MTDEQLKQWVIDNEEWMVKVPQMSLRVSDVKYPFILPRDNWLNLLIVASYEEIIKSKYMERLLRNPKVHVKPLNLPDILKALRAKPHLIPISPKPEPEPNKSKPWVLNNIPKVAYFYWGAPKLSFFKFMSLYSFVKMNPDWRTVLYYNRDLSCYNPWGKPSEFSKRFVGRDYTRELNNLPIDIVDCHFTELIGESNSISEVHKSDFLRWHLLGNYGGLWSDMDIIYFRPMSVFNKNTEAFKKYIGFVAKGKRYHRIGFLLSSKGNCFYKQLLKLARKDFKRIGYQSVGSEMLDNHFPDIEQITQLAGAPMGNIDDSTVYFFNHLCVYYCFFANGLSYIRPDSVGLHWYGGATYAKHIINKVNHENYLTLGGRFECTPVKILQKYFPEGIKI